VTEGAREAVDLSVVVPVYRNADTVEELFERLARALGRDERAFEVVFVDDACPHGSLAVLRRLAERDARAVVVPLPTNLGQHRAVLTGLARARGRRVVVMDADLQDPPEEVPRLLRALDEGYAAAFGGRHGRYESAAKLLTSRLFKTLLHLLCGVPADAGMFVALERTLLEEVVALGAGEGPFVVALIGACGRPMTSVPVTRAPRRSGRSAYSSWLRLRTALGALTWAAWWRWRRRWRGSAAGGGRAAHNRFQRSYYEGPVKRHMLPVDSPYLRRHVDELLRFGQITARDRVLEIGCGMGRYTLLLARRGIPVEGLDLSPLLLERLRARAGPGLDIPLHCGDVADPPAGLHGRFDVVVGLFVLHHLWDLGASFEALSRLLKPNGQMVFLEPNPYNVLYYAQMAIRPGMTWRGDRGIVRMRRRVVFGAMTRAGLGHPALERFGFFPPLLANRAWGARLERALERIPPLTPILPFQLFRCERG
jgi:glycosyltransferase involved in cell wall biosynthesis